MCGHSLLSSNRNNQAQKYAPHLHSAISAADRWAAALDADAAEDDDEWENVDDGLRGAHPFLNRVIYSDA
jgi:hypothetical protein